MSDHYDHIHRDPALVAAVAETRAMAEQFAKDVADGCYEDARRSLTERLAEFFERFDKYRTEQIAVLTKQAQDALSVSPTRIVLEGQNEGQKKAKPLKE